jgi:elongation factor 1-alpha
MAPSFARARLVDVCLQDGHSTFAYSYYMNTLLPERQRAISIESHARELLSDTTVYEVRNVPGHVSFLQNMYRGSCQADVAVMVVPADASFPNSIARGNKRAGDRPGGTRLHGIMLYVAGVENMIVCINKMDSEVAKYSEERFNGGLGGDAMIVFAQLTVDCLQRLPARLIWCSSVWG